MKLAVFRYIFEYECIFLGLNFFDCTCYVDIMKISSFVDFDLSLVCTDLCSDIDIVNCCIICINYLTPIPSPDLIVSVTIETILSCSKSPSHMAANVESLRFT